MHCITKCFLCILIILFIQSQLGFIVEAEENAGTKNSISCALSHIVYYIFSFSLPDVNYLLFTPKNPQTPCDLQPNEKALRKCDFFNPDLPTIVLLHGWIAALPKDDLKFILKDKILEQGDYNVVVHNWTLYSRFKSPAVIGYPVDSILTFFIGLRLSAWIKFLQKRAGAKPEMFHLNGHSLGCHIASYAAKTTCHLGRITYMDAAGPLFRFLPSFLKPSYKDALHTEAMHVNGATNGLKGLALEEPYAHVDFYVNGGNQQPKCYKGAAFRDANNDKKTASNPVQQNSCDHYSIYEYYLASFNKNCSFLGLICKKYEDYKNGQCNSDNSVPCNMDFTAINNPKLPPLSKCFLDTSMRYPYCLN